MGAITKLPSDIYFLTFSHMTPTDRRNFAASCRRAREVAPKAAEKVALAFDYPYITSCGPDTLIGKIARVDRIARGIDFDNTRQGKVDFVNRVRKTAAQSFKGLDDRTKLEIGLDPAVSVSDASFEQLNRAHQLLKDQSLIKLFDKISEQIDPNIPLPPVMNDRRQYAESISNWMREHEADLQAITHLDLSNINLSYLPSEITLLNNLEILNLSNNPLISLPENFNPPHLVQLILTNTRVRDLPNNFNPPQLEYLYLGNTQIRALPIDFNPPLLGYLCLKNTPIRALPNNFNPPLLQNLELQNTLIHALPENFNPFLLDCLNLENTQIEALPDGFNPPNLRYLHLSNTPIRALPDNFNPPELGSLELGNTLIDALPDNFNPPLLGRLNLDGTLIDALPENFNPPELCYLFLSKTYIHTLPEHFNPPLLIALCLKGTFINALPENFNPPRLEHLNLSGSDIGALPENFNPPNLGHLNLNNTPIRGLPDRFNPPLLECLDLERTQIKALPLELSSSRNLQWESIPRSIRINSCLRRCMNHLPEWIHQNRITLASAGIALASFALNRGLASEIDEP